MEGAPNWNQRDNQTVALSLTVVKHFPAAVDSCPERVATRVLKAVSRAQRGRSEIEEARSVLNARVRSAQFLSDGRRNDAIWAPPTRP